MTLQQRPRTVAVPSGGDHATVATDLESLSSSDYRHKDEKRNDVAKIVCVFPWPGRRERREEGVVGEDEARFWTPLAACLAMLVLSTILPGTLVEGAQFFQNTKSRDVILYANGLAVIPQWIFLLWGMGQLTKSLQRAFPMSDDETAKPPKSKWSSRTAILLLYTLLNETLRKLALTVVNSDYEATVNSVFDIMSGFAVYTLWASCLDYFIDTLHLYADTVEQVAGSNPKSQKWKSIMAAFSDFHDDQLNKAYGVPGGSRSPARVLAEIFTIYTAIGKVGGFLILYLYLIGVNLFENLIIFGLMGLGATVITALHIQNGTVNLIPLALSNAFHVGDIVSMSPTGSAPPDNPAAALAGFVEAVTMSHVVIRDFRKKQVFVPHSAMVNLMISNWTRRPAKLCHFVIGLGPRSGGAPAAELAAFCRRWIDAHPDIDHSGYTKAVAKLGGGGSLGLEVIFYPRIGAKAPTIRTEFIVAVMDAAKHLGLSMVPTYIREATPWSISPHGAPSDRSDEGEDPVEMQLRDLMPSERLTSRAGYTKKKTA